MNFLEAVSRVFPEGAKVTDCASAHPTIGVEVHNLQRDFVPTYCEIIASGQFQYFADQECRHSYLIKVQEYVLLVRILPSTESDGRWVPRCCAQFCVRNHTPTRPMRSGGGYGLKPSNGP